MNKDIPEEFPLSHSQIINVNDKKYRVFSEKEIKSLNTDSDPKETSCPKESKSIQVSHFVGKLYMGYIYGRHGHKKKKIEESTRCKLYIPSIEEETHFIKIEGKSMESIEKCKQEILKFIPKRPPLTHFISIRLGGHSKRFQNFQKELNSEFPRILWREMFISSHRLHFTFNVLTLVTEDEVNMLKKVLNEQIRPFIQDLFSDVETFINFDSLKCFPEDNPKRARVLYLHPKESEVTKRLCQIQEFLTDTLMNYKLIPMTTKKEFTLHSTVANIKFSKRHKNNFDCTKILEKGLSNEMKSLKFHFKNLEVSLMGVEETKSVYYKCVHKVSFK